MPRERPRFISLAAEREALHRRKAEYTQGIPEGGTQGQVLCKDSNADYDTHWIDPQSGGSSDLKPFSITGGGSNILAAITQQVLSSVEVSNSNYIAVANSITVTAPGVYLVMYNILIDEDSTAGGTRGRVTAHMKNGAAAIPNSYSGVYTREASGGTGLGASFLTQLGPLSVLSLHTDQDGNGTPDLSAERISVSILKVG
jgi:hypothetical protein